jgi:hypothetical protein
MTSHFFSQVSESKALVWQARFADVIRLIVAPMLLFFSGFFTMDFLLSGAYSWPRTSRVMALTLTLAVLLYEFIYKEQQARHPEQSFEQRLRMLLYSCVIPYVVGACALIALARLAA